jgi:asparagine synthase (glutamine-hydrolysing)
MGAAPAVIPIERMAAPIARFERTSLKSAMHTHGAVALSGSIDCTSLFEESGLIVALWGSPGQHARVVARRWRSHGALAGAALSGAFAFVVLDAQRGEALVAVDRFATRPLFYQLCGQSLLFASAQDALLRHPLAGRTPAAQALLQYLVLGAMPGSAWEGQQQLGPGECVHWRSGRLVRHTWWRMRFHENTVRNGAGLGAAVQTALADARGEQQPGVMLSGGSASGAVAAQLQREAGDEPVRTFSVGYANGEETGRPHPGRQAARALGTRHHHQVVRPADLVDAIPKLAALADRPCGATSAVAHYHCALLARALGTLRLFSGAGLADLFGAGTLGAALARTNAGTALRVRLLRLMGHKQFTALDVPAHMLQTSLFGTHANTMLAPAFLEQIDGDAFLALLRQWWWSTQCRTGTNRAIALDLRLHLPAQLAATHLGCFLAGVDVAFPFLDDAVVDCAAHTDPRDKHPGMFTQHARSVRALAPRGMPRGAPAAPLPLTAWLQADPDLRALAFDSLADLRRRTIVAPRVIDDLLDTKLTDPAPAFGTLVWQLMMLEQWFVHRAPHRLLGSAAAVDATVESAMPAAAPQHVDDPLPARAAG